MKKLIAYQKLLLSSIPPFGISSLKPPEKLIFGGSIFLIFLMDIVIFTGNTSSTETFFFITLPIICVWMINRILYGSYRLFDTVPVSKKYIFLNILLLPIVIICISFIAISILNIVLIGSLIGILYLVSPQSLGESAPGSDILQIIDTTKANLLMLCVVVIILFLGIAITFIKNKKLRLFSFVAFTTIGYGLLFFLRINMPISPNSTKVEFFESFSVMPEAGIILSCVAIATVIICISSCLISYNFYVAKSKDTNY